MHKGATPLYIPSFRDAGNRSGLFGASLGLSGNVRSRFRKYLKEEGDEPLPNVGIIS